MRFIRDIIGEKQKADDPSSVVQEPEPSDAHLADRLLAMAGQELDRVTPQPVASEDPFGEAISTKADAEFTEDNIFAEETRETADVPEEVMEDLLKVGAPDRVETPQPARGKGGASPFESIEEVDSEATEQSPAPSVAQMATPTLPSEARPAERKRSREKVKTQFFSSSSSVSPSETVAVPEPTVGRGASRGARAKTRLLGFNAGGFDEADEAKPAAASAAIANFPVGWLIVIEGEGRGSAFTLFDGVSTIGRGEDQTVRLDFGDNSISRDSHASIAYDARQRSFYIGHGGKANIVRRNDRPVLSTEEMSAGDQITIGETILRFVPFCGTDFSWGGATEADQHHVSRG